MKQTDKHTLQLEAERLERIASDVAEFDRFNAQKLRGIAKTIRTMIGARG